jgi:ribosomal protein L32
MGECPTCHEQTPEGNFCVRCGAPLEQGLHDAGARTQFAAAPGERRNEPRIISTLFPQLPRHSTRHFREALLLGTLLVVVLGALRLFPVALISAALLLPLLTSLYFYDVDIYEGEPWWALAWTFGWGGVTGAAVGVLAKAIAPGGTSIIDRASTANVLTLGILVPAVGVALMLVGPIVLLRYRRFNETLDGTTFGAATAATFAAAQAVVVGVGVLGGGLRPAGGAAPWVARLLAIAVATPVLAMSAIGAAAAALWLRYRAPVRDRNVLGGLGRPAVAVGISALLIIAGAIGETLMAPGLWLAWLVALDLVGLILLRRAMHVGLLEEADEIEIGPEITCANCGARTASHTFCGNCGIALKALPKRPGGDQSPSGRGVSTGRLRHGSRRLAIFAGASAGIAGVAVAVAALGAPPAPKPRCHFARFCGAPPVLPHVLAGAPVTFPGYSAWQSVELGYGLRYNSGDWHITRQGPREVVLEAGDGFSLLEVAGLPTSSATPGQALNAKVASLKAELLGMVRDTDPSDRLLGPNVGLRPGSGDVYRGTVNTPQGPQAPVAVAIMAATDSRVTVVTTVIAPGNNTGQRAAVYARADDVINSVQWSGP